MTEQRQIRRLTNLRDQVDTEHPNPARMYDYFLGGAANFAADREAAERAAVAFPNIRSCVRQNRAFLNRAVHFLCMQGVHQFLDLGSGMPTVGNVHDIAHQHNPAAKVAYVDHEPVVVAHARRLLDGDPRITITQADIRKPGEVLVAPEVAGLLDFGRPIAVLAVAILHFVPDSYGPQDILATYRNASAPGSYLALSHISQVTLTDAQVAAFTAIYQPTPGVFRTQEEIRKLFAGYEMIDPGLLLVPKWRSEQQQPLSQQDSEQCNLYGAVGYLPPR